MKNDYQKNSDITIDISDLLRFSPNNKCLQPLAVQQAKLSGGVATEILGSLFLGEQSIYEDPVKHKALTEPGHFHSSLQITFRVKDRKFLPRHRIWPLVIEDAALGIHEIHYQENYNSVIASKKAILDSKGRPVLGLRRVSEQHYVQTIQRYSDANIKLAQFNGSKAFFQGKSLSDNPYRYNQLFSIEWNEAFESAQRLFEQFTQDRRLYTG